MSNYVNSDATAVLKSMLSIGQPATTRPASATSDPSISVTSSLQRKLDGISYEGVSRHTRASSETPSVGSSVFTEERSSVTCEKQDKQTITLDGTEQNATHCVESNMVDVISSKLSTSLNNDVPHNSHVDCKLIIRQRCSERLIEGHLISIHHLQSYVAFVIPGKTSKCDQGVDAVSKTSDSVHTESLDSVYVINQRTVQRTRLSGFTHCIIDIGFARRTDALLAVLDDLCVLNVYSLTPGVEDKLNARLLLRIDSSVMGSARHTRLAWCPYIPASQGSSVEEEEDLSQLIAVSQNNTVIYNIGLLRKRYVTDVNVEKDSQYGKVVIPPTHHQQDVVEMLFSPDGSPLATACADGYVRFFSINDPPKCMFKWMPHSGAALSSLVFLDDMKNYTTETQFWRYAVTGALENREMKIWTCDTWSCVQTLTFHPSLSVPLAFRVQPSLKICVDPCAQHLVITDVKRKVLYVCKLDVESGLVSHISEYITSHSALYIHIIDTVLTSSTPEQDIRDMGQDIPVIDEDIRASGQDTRASGQDTRASGQDTHALDEGTSLRLYSIGSGGIYLSSIKLVSDRDEYTHHYTKPLYNFIISLDVRSHSSDVSSSHTCSDVDSDINSPTRAAAQSLDKITTRPASTVTNTVNQTVVSASNNQSTCQSTTESTNHILNLLFSQSADQRGVAQQKSHVNNDKMTSSEEQTVLMSNRLTDISRVTVSESNRQTGSETNRQTGSETNRQTGSETNRQTGSETNRQTGSETNRQTKSESCRQINNETENNMRIERSNGGLEAASVQYSHTCNFIGGDELVTRESLQHVLDMIKQQQQAINSIRHDLIYQSQSCTQSAPSDPHTAPSDLCEERSSDDLDHRVHDLISKAVMDLAVSNESELHGLQSDLVEVNIRESEKLSHTLSESISSLALQALPNIVLEEVQKNIIPVVTRTLEPVIKRQVTEVGKRLTASDAVLRDSISKMFRAKKTHESLSRVVADSSCTVLTQSSAQVLNQCFSRGMNEISDQLNNTFTLGLNQYSQSQAEFCSAQLSKGEKLGQQCDSLLTQLFAGRTAGCGDVQQLCGESLQQIGSVQLLQTAANEENLAVERVIQDCIQRYSGTLRDTLRAVIREEIDNALRDHESVLCDRITSTLSSRCPTPAPLTQGSTGQGGQGSISKSHLQTLISQQQYNQAFTLALGAADLSILLYVCEGVDASTLFPLTPCPLHQSTLLSLIHQLSIDLINDSDIKHRYLEEAVTQLDTRCQSTQDHAPRVLNSLYKALNSVLESNTSGGQLDNATRRQVKLLSSVVRAQLREYGVKVK